MSKERPSVIGIVVATICVTSTVMVGGWVAATRFLGQPPASAPREEPPPAPTPKHKTPRAPRSVAARSSATESASPASSTSPAVSTVADPGGAASHDDSAAASTVTRESSTPSAESEPAAGTDNRVSATAPRPSAPLPAPAANEPTDARSIMEEAQRRTEARSYQYAGLLESYDGKGKVAEKRWTFDRIGAHGRSKAVVRFTSPPEVKGVALLIDNHPDRASDQWMWTPAIERDRRIASQDRSTRFFGTDFSFEDLEERDVDQYEYSLLGSDTVAGAACWKIQMMPRRTRASQYTRSIAWIRKDDYVVARQDNFANDDVVRRLAYSSIENVQGIWTARQIEVADLHRGSRTRLTLQKVGYNVPMKEDDFTLQAIRR